MSDVGDLDTKGVRGREQIWREGRDAGGRRKRGGGTIQEAVGQRTDAAKGVDCEGQKEDVVREEVLRDTRGRGRDTSSVDAIGTTKLRRQQGRTEGGHCREVGDRMDPRGSQRRQGGGHGWKGKARG